MEIGTLVVLTAIYKLAEQGGILEYIEALPEKTLDAVHERLIQDTVFEEKFRKFFRSGLEKGFEHALAKIAPVNETLKRRFVLAVLTEPTIRQTLQNLNRGQLPQRKILTPIFTRLLSKSEVENEVARFVDALYAELRKDREFVDLVTLTISERLEQHYELLQRVLATLENKLPSTKEEPFKISIAKLPTTSGILFGREAELRLLDQAWADEHTHLVSFVAWGGVGKTALVNEWLSRLEAENYRGAERVFGWSFYSQGTKEDRNVSADSFFDEALRWFGYNGPVILSPWDKGVRLAELLRQQKTLLILDGVEPLQYPPGPLHGELKDQGLKALLKELSRANFGLCVVTTRVGVKDIAHTEGKSSRRVQLENLSAEAGAHLLRHLEVKGTDKELLEASQEFGGHALALNLLGRYLAVVHQGEIRKRDLIPHLTEEEEQGGHARRVMESYERWLAGTPECNILYLMGLFDRPATAGALDALRAQPAIEGLTTELQKLKEAKWQYAVQRLRDLRLLAAKDESRPDTLDCHPLVREHFGEKLRTENPKAWQEAHGRLYEYYKKLPAKHLPETLEEMEPLFAAVAHGCQAGKYQEALDDVYWRRVRREQEAYTIHRLGAYGADLTALSSFFDPPWQKPVAESSIVSKAALLSWAGFRLRALGRLAEAAKPMQMSLDELVVQKDWKKAAGQAGNLSELLLTMGEVAKAVTAARHCVNFADRSGGAIERCDGRTTLAEAFHQFGELAEAQKLFLEAEAIQQQHQPEYRCLYSLRGYRFCDLLLSQEQVVEVLQRASHTLQWFKDDYPVLSKALDYLSLGRAHLLQVTDRLLTATGQYELAETYLNQAVASLLKAGTQDYLPRGLLARAALYRVQGEFTKALADLDEAREIAERGGMGLHLADYHLEASRLCLAEGKRQEAKEHLDIAAEMIEKMGYGRRKPEVDELKRELA